MWRERQVSISAASCPLLRQKIPRKCSSRRQAWSGCLARRRCRDRQPTAYTPRRNGPEQAGWLASCVVLFLPSQFAATVRSRCRNLRSTVRDWAAGSSSHPRGVAEMALAHSIGGRVGAADPRNNLFEKYYQLIEDRVGHCCRRQPPQQAAAIQQGRE